MNDPLSDAHSNGHQAGMQLISILRETNDIEECVNQIRQAALNDSKFNWHLIESIALLAAAGQEAAIDRLKKNSKANGSD